MSDEQIPPEAPTKTGRKPRAKAPALPPSADADRSKLTQYQKFEVRRMVRSAIKGAPYNPRLITPQAKKRLERNLKNPKVGLLEPLTVNEVTGFTLVAGHQRLATLDLLEGRDDYEMDFAVVQLDEKTEREQNAFMNNPGAMGSWDIDALGKMGFRYDGEKLDWTAAGFDKIDLEDMFAGTQYSADMESLFASAETSKGAAETLAGMADMGAVDPLPSDAPPGDKHVVAFMAGAAGQDGPKGAQKAIESFRAQEHVNNQIKADAEDTETFAVVLFPSRAERDKFMVQCGQPQGERYIDIATLADALGLKL